MLYRIAIFSKYRDTSIYRYVSHITSRMNMAAKLSTVKLFDEKMMLTYNVSGRGKPKLTSIIIEYIKLQCFKFCPCIKSKNMDEEWSEYVKIIDKTSRRLKKQRKGSVTSK